MNRIAYLTLVATLLIIPNTVSAQRRGQNESGLLRQGTNVRVRFPDNLDSDRNRNGDQFEAFLDQDLVSNGRVLARSGSVVYFTLVDVNAGGGARRDRSRVSLTLTGIQVESSLIPIETNTITIGTAPNRNQRVNFRTLRIAAFDRRDIPPGAAQQNESGFLRPGTIVQVRFADNMGSDRNRNGDRFEAFLGQDLVSNGRILARAGSVVFFTLVDANARGGLRGYESRLSLTLTGIQGEYSVIPIETDTIAIRTEPNTNQMLNFRIQRGTALDRRDNQPEAARRK